MPHQCTNCGRTFPDGSKKMLSGCPDCGGNKFQFTPSTTGSGTNAESGDESESVEAPSETDSSGVTSRAAETVRGWVSSSSSDDDETRESPAPVQTETPAQSHEADERRSSSDRRPESEADTKSDGFTEWPDSARRPEDRSTATTTTETERTAPEDSDLGSTSTSVDESSTADSDPSTLEASEDSAQADARSEVVPTDDLPTGTGHNDGTGVITDVTEGEPTTDRTADQPPDHGRVVSEPSGDQPSIEELRAELNEQFESIKIVRPGQYELNLMELYNRDEYIISLQEDGRYVIDVPDSWRDDAEQ